MVQLMKGKEKTADLFDKTNPERPRRLFRTQPVRDLCVHCLPATRWALASHRSRGQALEDFLTRGIAAGEVGEIPRGLPRGLSHRTGVSRRFWRGSWGAGAERGETSTHLPSFTEQKGRENPIMNQPALTSQSHQGSSRRLQ